MGPESFSSYKLSPERCFQPQIESQNFSKTETIDHSYGTQTKLRKYVGGRNCTSIPIGGQDVPCRDKENAGSGSVKAIFPSLIPPPMGPHLPWKKLWAMKTP